MVLEVKLSMLLPTMIMAVTSVLVKFDNERLGLKAMQFSLHHLIFLAVPLAKYEVVCLAKRK